MTRTFLLSTVWAALGLTNAAFAQNAEGEGLAGPSLAAVQALNAPAKTEEAATPEAEEALPTENTAEAKSPAPTRPSVLSDADAARYGRIFDLQKDGDWRAADREIAALDDRVLMGHVMEQRLMHPSAYRSSYGELKAWMRDYADHPGAGRVHRLARLRRPADGGWLKGPEPAPPRAALSERPIHPDFAARSAKARLSEPHVRRLIRRGQLSFARDYLDREDVVSGLTGAERDRLIARVAYARFLGGDMSAALADARAVAERRGEAIPLALKTQGLAAWAVGDFEAAEAGFAGLIDHAFADEHDRALGGYWAARARMRLGRYEEASAALEAAAGHGFEFYGLLAGAVLGRVPAHAGVRETDEEVVAHVIETFPSARRAAALIEVGRHGDADEELRLLFRRAEPEWDDDLLIFAAALKLPATQIEIAEASAEGAAEALYPLPSYAPAGGFEVDRALIYAIMRQESRFKTEAVSRAGARGLMQIMPRTASFIGRDRTLHYRSRRRELLEPDLNLDLAQDYVGHLMEDWTDGDMIRTLIAYNAGPGNLRKWDRSRGAVADPLLYVESVPNDESRHYVKAVLRNVWIYRGRLGQRPTSLEALAGGLWPRYHHQDPRLADIGEGGAGPL